MTRDWNSVQFPDLADFIRASRPTQPLDRWEECGFYKSTYHRYLDEKAAAIEKSLLLASEFQPAQAPAPGEDPATELQLSFFETPGFVKTP